MTIDQIKEAVDGGKNVHWVNKGYRVHRDRLGQYLITFGTDTGTIGLTDRLGKSLNGKPDEFFIAA